MERAIVDGRCRGRLCVGRVRPAIDVEAYVRERVGRRHVAGRADIGDVWQGALVTLFGVSTLVLTLAGLYARVSYGVAHRARECAVRQAVGATPPRVVWLLVQGVATGAAGGLLLGITALPVLAGTVAHLAFEVSLTDAQRAGAAALVISIAIAVASYLPARALSAMNLADTLRAE